VDYPGSAGMLVTGGGLVFSGQLLLDLAEHGMSREDAYQLVSVSSDVDITQLVDGTVGVHVMIPKAIFTGQ